MLSNPPRRGKPELSTADLLLLEDTAPASSKKRKQEFKEFTTSIRNEKKHQTGQQAETPSTPEKMKCHVAGNRVKTPSRTRYKIGKPIGEGNSGEVFLCSAKDGSRIALKKRTGFLFFPHPEAKKAAEFAHQTYGRGAYFCSKQPEQIDCKDEPHYLTMPYFPGKNPEAALEDYFEVIFEKKNEDSLVMFALLTVFIAMAKSYEDFSEQKKLFHGDAKPQNMQLTISPDTKQLQLVIIDFDHTREIGDLTCGEAALYQGKELNAQVPADPRSDVYSIGFFYDDMMKCLVNNETYDSREAKGNSTKRGILNTFFNEMDDLESLIKKMMLDEDRESYKKRPLFSTVVIELEAIFKSAQQKFVQIDNNDFNEAMLLQAPQAKPVSVPDNSLILRDSLQKTNLFAKKESEKGVSLTPSVEETQSVSHR